MRTCVRAISSVTPRPTPSISSASASTRWAMVTLKRSSGGMANTSGVAAWPPRAAPASVTSAPHRRSVRPSTLRSPSCLGQLRLVTAKFGVRAWGWAWDVDIPLSAARAHTHIRAPRSNAMGLLLLRQRLHRLEAMGIQPTDRESFTSVVQGQAEAPGLVAVDAADGLHPHHGTAVDLPEQLGVELGQIHRGTVVR